VSKSPRAPDILCQSGGSTTRNEGRMKKRTARATAVLGATLMIAPIIAFGGTVAASAAGAATPIKVLTCTGKVTEKPATYLLSCADAGAGWDSMTWSAWNGSSATGHGSCDRTTAPRTALRQVHQLPLDREPLPRRHHQEIRRALRARRLSLQRERQKRRLRSSTWRTNADAASVARRARVSAHHTTSTWSRHRACARSGASAPSVRRRRRGSDHPTASMRR